MTQTDFKSDSANLPQTMRAVRVHRLGPPEVMALETVPVPHPGPGELLVKVSVSGVNYADVGQRRGSMGGPPAQGAGGPPPAGMQAPGMLAGGPPPGSASGPQSGPPISPPISPPIRALGADLALNYSNPGWEAAVLVATKGVNVLLESVGGAAAQAALSVMAQFGRTVMFGGASGQMVSPGAMMMGMMMMGLSFTGFNPWQRPEKAAGNAL